MFDPMVVGNTRRADRAGVGYAAFWPAATIPCYQPGSFPIQATRHVLGLARTRTFVLSMVAFVITIFLEASNYCNLY